MNDITKGERGYIRKIKYGLWEVVSDTPVFSVYRDGQDILVKTAQVSTMATALRLLKWIDAGAPDEG